MKHLPANSVSQSSLKGSKSADRASRLAAKPHGVKFAKGKVIKQLNGRRSLARSDDSPKAYKSHQPRLGLPKGELLQKTPSTYVGRLSCVADWHRQVSKIYRQMRRGQIEASLGTKLTFVANIGASIARWIEETTPKGISVPPNYDLLSADELAQLEALLAKAAGPRAQERITQATSGETYDN
jgi:hypothetical protein